MTFAVCGLIILLALQQYLSYSLQLRWTILLAEKQGVSSGVIEPNKPEEPAKAKIDTRQRMSIPVPGADMFRKPQ